MLKVAGEQLKNNLTRSGVNLSFDTDLLYLDVINGRIGIKTVTPDVQLDVQGAIRSQELHLSDLSDSKKWSILPDINGNLVLSYNATHIFTLNELSTILDKDNKSIVRMDTLTDLDTSQSKNQADLVLKSDGDGTYSFVAIDSLISEDTEFSVLTAGDIQLGITLPNQIDTSGGDLVLDSATNKVIIRGEFAATEKVLLTGQTTILDLTVPNDVQLNDIKIENNTITSTAGDLVLTSDNGIVSVDGELLVNGRAIAQPIIFSDTAPNNSSHGNIWMDTVNGTLYVNYNDSWIQPSYTPLLPTDAPELGGRTIVSETKPTFNIEVGDTWFDLISGRFYVYAAHNSWIQPGYPLLQGSSPYVAASFISETPPTNSVDGNLWLDSTTGQFYIKAQDTWIQPVTGAATTAQKSTAYTQPTDPGDDSVDGDIWFDTLNREIFVRYNRSWLAPAVKGDYESEIRTNELFLSNDWSLRIVNNELHFVYQNVPVFEIAPNGLLKVTNDIIADGDVQ